MTSRAKAYSVVKIILNFWHKPLWDFVMGVGFAALKQLPASLASVQIPLFDPLIPISVRPLFYPTKPQIIAEYAVGSDVRAFPLISDEIRPAIRARFIPFNKCAVRLYLFSHLFFPFLSRNKPGSLHPPPSDHSGSRARTYLPASLPCSVRCSV